MMYGIAYKKGPTVCQSSLPYLGYSLDILKDMEKAGYVLLIDGRQAKYPTAAQYKEVHNA